MTQPRFALVGNPNIGKTSLFNALTGAHQKVGNWPGVTVEKKEGYFDLDDYRANLLDLPGIYSLSPGATALDETIARRVLEQDDIDAIINIVDASNLKRNLLLTQELCQLGKPLVVVLNMSDAAQRNGIHIDEKELSRRLGVPVVSTIAKSGAGIDRLRQVLLNLIAGEVQAPASRSDETLASDSEAATYVERFAVVERTLDGVVRVEQRAATGTDAIDRIVLNRWLGIPIFLAVMYLLFTFAISIGSLFIDFFDIVTGVFLIDSVRWLCEYLHLPLLLTTLLADGVGGGITLVATFIPVIAFLYLGLSFIEDSGYMSRAAFVADRVMAGIGLPGNAFVPLIVGFGCNVPAVMASRTMSRQSDRLLTIAMAPFMSCGARLTVYVLFAAAFFPHNGQNMVFLLYLMGIVVAVGTGYIFKRQLFAGETSSSVQEMPAYHRPSLRNMLIATWIRLKGFIFSAGKAIVAVVVVLSLLNSLGTDGSFGNEDSEQSVLASIGKSITPVFSPIGISEENWPATVGLFTGMFAKEAIVGTLDALYSDVHSEDAAEGFPDIPGAIAEAFATIGAGLADIGDVLLDPLGISIGTFGDVAESAAEQEVQVDTLSRMASLFASQVAAFSYLSFVLLYAPCVAVVGAMVRESGLRWAILVFAWATWVAYFVAMWIYQIANLVHAPGQAMGYLGASLVLMLFAIHGLKHLGTRLQINNDRVPLLNL